MTRSPFSALQLVALVVGTLLANGQILKTLLSENGYNISVVLPGDSGYANASRSCKSALLRRSLLNADCPDSSQPAV